MRSAVPSLKFHRITSSRFNVNAGPEIPESVSDRGIVFFFHIYEIRSLTLSAHPGLTRIWLCFYYNERKRNAFLCRRICRNDFLFLGVKRRPTVRTQRKTTREEDKHFTRCLFIKTGCSFSRTAHTNTILIISQELCATETRRKAEDWLNETA